MHLFSQNASVSGTGQLLRGAELIHNHGTYMYTLVCVYIYAYICPADTWG